MNFFLSFCSPLIEQYWIQVIWEQMYQMYTRNTRREELKEPPEWVTSDIRDFVQLKMRLEK